MFFAIVAFLIIGFLIAIFRTIIIRVGFLRFLLYLSPFIAVAAIIVTVLLKRARKKLEKTEDYLKSEQGKKDVKALTDKMKSLGIAIPYVSSITTLYASDLNRSISNHYGKNFIPDGFSEIINMGKIKLIYNKEEVLILPEKCTSIESKYKIAFTSTGINYSSTIPSSGVHNLSSFFESLEKEYSKTKVYWDSKRIKLKDFYWRTEGGMSSTTSLCDTAAGAVLGAIIAGPIGALGGGMHSKQQQNKADKRTLVIGDKRYNHTRWEIKEIHASYISSDSTIKKLEQLFPDNKLPNLYYD